MAAQSALAVCVEEGASESEGGAGEDAALPLLPGRHPTTHTHTHTHEITQRNTKRYTHTRSPGLPFPFTLTLRTTDRAVDDALQHTPYRTRTVTQTQSHKHTQGTVPVGRLCDGAEVLHDGVRRARVVSDMKAGDTGG